MQFPRDLRELKRLHASLASGIIIEGAPHQAANMAVPVAGLQGNSNPRHNSNGIAVVKNTALGIR